MSTQYDHSAEFPASRRMKWAIQRELWENRSIYIAPLLVAGFVLFASLIGLFGLPHKMRTLPADPAQQHLTIIKSFSMAPAPIMLATLIVAFFYCLDALYGERRDRSILFWKSLPVSDSTTVLSKVSIPMFVLPMVGFLLGWFTQLVLLFMGTGILWANGMSASRLWTEMNVLQDPLVMIYGMGVFALWYAPIYAWLLLISAWSRRTPFLWAVLPPMVVGIMERIVSKTKWFGLFLKARFAGPMETAFGPKGTHNVIDRLADLTPGRYLMTPGLWVGLIFAAAFLALAIRLRRNREPI